ncbi:MAG: hypothetical protein SFW36_04375, partial [Leptolyngbyaceae cyanobacterium bins.59]|nr:hypothetical protein [Leptolyngbyaceae cyanobacterium bins.59]
RKLQSDRVGDAIELEVPPVEQWYAVLYLYRDGKDSPLHALGAGLWFGQEERYRLKPIHCFGMTQKKIQEYTVKVLEAFGEQCETPLRGYKEMFDIDPHRCPIRPCPLYLN